MKMNKIDEYLSSKIGKKASVNSGANNGIYAEMQYDADSNAEYHTLDITRGMDAYKKGFIHFNKENNYVAMIAFNKPEDFAELLGDEQDSWKFLNTASVGSTSYHDDDIFMRIW